MEHLLMEALALPCLTGEEAPMAQWLLDHVPGADVRRIGNSAVAGRLSDPRPMVALVSHLDVVPPTEVDLPPRVESEHIFGRGASDMKSGLAVALELFTSGPVRDGWANVVLVGYAGEEGPHEGNELPAVLRTLPVLRNAALAIILEPTDVQVQLGCLGGLHATVEFSGKAAHSARPWHGTNALTAAGAWLSSLHERSPEPRVVDGLEYVEVMSATQGQTFNSRNIIPDRFAINLNYRFSPDRSLNEAEANVRALCDGMADIEIVDRAPPAPPSRNVPIIRHFIDSVEAEVQPKQAWTDVARFAEVGVPALNFGPGLTGQAHQRGEYVPRANLETAYDALARFLA